MHVPNLVILANTHGTHILDLEDPAIKEPETTAVQWTQIIKKFPSARKWRRLSRTMGMWDVQTCVKRGTLFNGNMTGRIIQTEYFRHGSVFKINMQQRCSGDCRNMTCRRNMQQSSRKENSTTTNIEARRQTYKFCHWGYASPAVEPHTRRKLIRQSKCLSFTASKTFPESINSAETSACLDAGTSASVDDKPRDVWPLWSCALT